MTLRIGIQNLKQAEVYAVLHHDDDHNCKHYHITVQHFASVFLRNQKETLIGMGHKLF